MNDQNNAEVKAQKAKIETELDEHRAKLSVLTRMFYLLSATLGWHPLRSRPDLVPSCTDHSRRLRYGAWASAIIGSLLFGVLNVISLEGAPGIIFGVSLLFAVLFGCVAAGIASRLLKVDVMEPRTSLRADCALIAGGLLTLTSFSVFCFLRFSQDENSRSALPWCAMAFELGCLVYSTAAMELRVLYSWPEKMTSEYEYHQQEIDLLQSRISVYSKQLWKENIDVQNAHNNNERASDSDQSFAGIAGNKPAISPRELNGSAGLHHGDDRSARS